MYKKNENLINWFLKHTEKKTRFSFINNQNKYERFDTHLTHKQKREKKSECVSREDIIESLKGEREEKKKEEKKEEAKPTDQKNDKKAAVKPEEKKEEKKDEKKPSYDSLKLEIFNARGEKIRTLKQKAPE